ncbi:unnamed protein product [Mytilus coruscus]|uniref:Uncharacterized protein n=1 Tax=Mytilus coruscus TaxID=42192 RepID=A0A6J8AR14_MYTCO|nr:unnamed protein product [Mytilus coruscus]
MKCGKRFLRVFPINIADLEQYQYLMELTLHCIHLYQCLKADPIQREKFVNLVCRLVDLDPRGTVNQTLLHLAVNPNTSKIESDEYTTFPSEYAVRVLLLCGANSSSKDENGYTPLESKTQNRNIRLLLPTNNLDSGVAFSAYKFLHLTLELSENNGNWFMIKPSATSVQYFNGNIYYYRWTTCAGGDDISVGIELVINNIVHGLMWTESRSVGEEECSSGFVIQTLSIGDTAFTRSQSQGSIGTIRSDQYMRTTF